MKSKESKKRSAKSIAFDSKLLLESLRGHANALEGKGKLTIRTTTLRLPKPAPTLRSREISAIRIRLGVSQPVFASILNVPVATARSWEQGKRSPSGAALRLLELVRRQPTLTVKELVQKPGVAA
jgi:putative transcriptional regulator